jgi:hypothetical protein
MSVFLDTIRWLIAIPTNLLFLLCVLGNWSLFIGAALGKLRSFSLVLPFLGPLFGIMFFVTVPIDGAARLWWVAALLEPTWLVAMWIALIWRFRNRT